jgi:ubiquitin C-terminal hydrolase
MAVLLLTNDILISARPCHMFAKGQGIVGTIVGHDFEFLSVVTPYYDYFLTLPLDCILVVGRPEELGVRPSRNCPSCKKKRSEPAVWKAGDRLLCLDCYHEEFNRSRVGFIRYELDPDTQKWVRTSSLVAV